ncbi:F0F1 ATP synthase subunit B [Acetonema longum]|uniref:ATP synthase subunit b n=1 Tax=Acetonema longum DSM 6540 TaxID=1009370 RepID=F7NIT7_9FIRM|nr:F0F1 ATP synthase subunit B [Acetonema longum]EGO64060.1 ATP synthase F0 subunit beta [Acetonema longum DSM 6540]
MEETSLFSINPTLIAQIINFLLLLLLLAKVAWKPLIQIIDERKAKIAADIDSAEQNRVAAAELKAEYQKHLAEARVEAQAIVEKAIKLADQTKDEILTAARAEHERLLKSAQEQIVRERQQALHEIRNEVVAISIAAAGKIISQNLNSDVNAKLVDDFIAKLDDKQGGLSC